MSGWDFENLPESQLSSASQLSGDVEQLTMRGWMHPPAGATDKKEEEGEISSVGGNVSGAGTDGGITLRSLQQQRSLPSKASTEQQQQQQQQQSLSGEVKIDQQQQQQQRRRRQSAHADEANPDAFTDYHDSVQKGRFQVNYCRDDE